MKKGLTALVAILISGSAFAAPNIKGMVATLNMEVSRYKAAIALGQTADICNASGSVRTAVTMAEFADINVLSVLGMDDKGFESFMKGVKANEYVCMVQLPDLDPNPNN